MNVKQLFKEIDNMWVSTADIGEVYYVISFISFMSIIVFGTITWFITIVKEVIK
ncbi:MAG: hypothetical protein QXI16_01245 [Sulfolobaceae archaeon]